MAAVGIKPFPAMGLDILERSLLQMASFLVPGDPIAYGDASGTAFTVPADTIVEAIGIAVETALNGGVVAELKFSDGTRVIAEFTRSSLGQADIPVMQAVLRKYSADTSITFTLSTDGATAGSIRPYLKVRLAGSKKDWLVRPSP